MKVRLYRHEVVIIFYFLAGIASSWNFHLSGQVLFRRQSQCIQQRSCGGIAVKHDKIKLLSVSNPDDTSILTHKNHDGEKFNQMVKDFIAFVEASIDNDQFSTFTLHGPTKDSFHESSEARGYLRMIKGRSIILSNKVVIQATFKYHGATDICKNWNILDCPKNLETIMVSTAVTPTVVPVSEWGPSPPTTFGLPLGIQSATLEVSNGTKWELKINRGTAKLKRYQSNKMDPSILQEKLNHDRNKYTFVDLTSPIWLALGVTSPSTGTVKPGMSSKLRQCQKFVEIVDRLVGDYINLHEESPISNITVVDMGCGRGYLTFALHSYLQNQYPESVSSRGIDVRPKLVQEISNIASGLGSEFERLRFEVGTIESFLAESPPEANEKGSIEVVIALHACDTASDDALWSGICRNSDVIVVAPCCHREVRPQLNMHVSGDKRSEHPYVDILRHNIYRERIAETITDSMRALLLELSGYTVQVFEFIGGEHTSKNVMITAVRNKKLSTFREKADELYCDKLERLQSLAQLHGIKKHKLASWIGVSLSECDTHSSVHDIVSSRSRPTKMPPLQG